MQTIAVPILWKLAAASDRLSATELTPSQASCRERFLLRVHRETPVSAGFPENIVLSPPSLEDYLAACRVDAVKREATDA